MAFSEILLFKPKLDPGDLDKMDKTLSGRFSKLAKGFGKGLRLGVLAAVGGAILQKLLSPLNEVREAIDKTLKTADDVVTNATQFQTTTEKLLKLRALGSLKGLQPEQIDTLLSKFQNAQAQFRLDPNNPSNAAVKNFSGPGDVADQFFQFIQSIQKLDATQRNLAQQQVFGEKQVLKMADFLQSDFTDSLKQLSSVDFAQVSKAVTKLGDLNDVTDRNRTINQLRDLIAKGNAINGGTVSAINTKEINDLKRENTRIQNFNQAASIEENINKMTDSLEQIVNEGLTQIPEIMKGLNLMVDLMKTSVKGWQEIFKLIRGSPIMRGIKGLFGGDKDGN